MARAVLDTFPTTITASEQRAFPVGPHESGGRTMGRSLLGAAAFFYVCVEFATIVGLMNST